MVCISFHPCLLTALSSCSLRRSRTSGELCVDLSHSLPKFQHRKQASTGPFSTGPSWRSMAPTLCWAWGRYRWLQPHRFWMIVLLRRQWGDLMVPPTWILVTYQAYPSWNQSFRSLDSTLAISTLSLLSQLSSLRFLRNTYGKASLCRPKAALLPLFPRLCTRKLPNIFEVSCSCPMQAKEHVHRLEARLWTSWNCPVCQGSYVAFQASRSCMGHIPSEHLARSAMFLV